MKLAKRPKLSSGQELKTPKSKKTPKKMKNASAKASDQSSNSKTMIVITDKESKLSEAKVEPAIELLLKGFKIKKKNKDSVDKKQQKNDLFAEDGERVLLQVTGIKLPKDNRRQIIKVILPHSPVPNPCQIGVFVKDLEKGIRPDHEPTVQHFRELFASKKIPANVDVIALRELRVEYKTFESKTALVHKYDKFLADDRIIRLLPKFLGKPFYKRRKIPSQVSLTSKDLKAEIDKGIRTVNLPLSHHGACAMIEVGNTSLTKSQLLENIMATANVLEKRYPGGFKNIRSLYLKSEKSSSIPLYLNTISPNDVGYVDSDAPKRITREVVTDELSTQPGMLVTVLPSGDVRIKRTQDAEWDDERDEPFVDGSESEEEEEDKGKKKEKLKKERKMGKKDKKKEKESCKKAKKRKPDSADNDSNSSEDEGIADAEQNYMKKVAEAEAGSSENEEGIESQSKKSKETIFESEGEEEDENGSEEEDKYDDDQELDSDDIIEDSDADEEESDDAEDDDKLILKNINSKDEEDESDSS